MESLPIIPNEFLEENLGQPVESFTIKAGTNVGDNYMSVLHSIDAKLVQNGKNETETTSFQSVTQTI